MKTIAETVDSSASVNVAPDRVQITYPEDFELPQGGLNIRWPDAPLDQEYGCIATSSMPPSLSPAPTSSTRS